MKRKELTRTFMMISKRSNIMAGLTTVPEMPAARLDKFFNLISNECQIGSFSSEATIYTLCINLKELP